MDLVYQYAGSTSLPLCITLNIPLILYLLYHFVLFPLFRSDLRSIPGPVLAKFTDLYRLLLVRTGSAHEHRLRLHKIYGPFVRLGPNNVSVGSPTAIPILYNTRTRYPKSAFYPVMGNVAHGKVVPTIFSTQDESIHETMKRPVAQVYAMTNLETYEPLVDSTESLFLSKLERFAEEERTLDLGTWLHWFATDVIMEITFGKRLGFLEREEDVDGILETIEKRFWYVAVAGQMPWLDKLLHKNPAVGLFARFGSKPRVSPVLQFALERIAERKRQRLDHPERKGQEPDFLGRFLDIQNNHSDIPDSWIISWCQQNVQAGSDSTAITLTSVMYHLMKNPESMKALVAELDIANLPSPIPWCIAHKLPYLDACIKEALRMTPAIGIPLERIVPAEGIELCGKYFGGGTVLGVNAWVVHRDQGVYGADAALWRPGRWIEASQDKRKEMERTLFAFGGGSRVCLGKNISYLEMYKAIPDMLRRFKFQLTDRRKEWSLKNGFFTYTRDFEVSIQRRESSGKH
ncbi:pisatin demethylase [Aspergillus pseudocaelatus]|uniref:Pisatin demethylase n=1 Tax=Aspergillus pseudocaelatus TaxID=1825620 RepID=A0ABQ6WTJ7_9EURO|nr:pisatin demethylase [Aspergillus pseudocaelatus]